MINMVGSEVAGYRIIAEQSPALDSGKACPGSQTYKAVAPDGETSVIIKLFPFEVSQNRQLLSQLHESMRAVYRLDHPNIPKIIGSGMDEGRPYIITPYVAAGSVQDRIDRGVLAALDVERVIVETASALEYAHSHRILHGNLKPSNILMDDEGHVQVFDFGQASVLGKLRSLETPPYSGEDYRAPEVIQGAGMTPLSDQYSIGLIALVLLTSLPAAEALLALNARLQSGSNPRIQAKQPLVHLSQKVIEVLSRAISINPQQRFGSMAELKRAFMTAFDNEEIPEIEPTSSPQQVHAPRRRKRRPLVALAATIAIFLCFAITLPVLSSFWKGSDNGSTTGTRLTPSANEPQHSTLSNQGESETTATNEGPSQQNPEATEPPAEATHDLPSIPTATERESSENQPEATATLQPIGTETITPTDTMQPTNTQTTTPTATQTQTDTQSPSATPTQEPTPTPPSIPTIDPSKCRDNPEHPHYCTPTP
jgi:serine/threonine-protein kinase